MVDAPGGAAKLRRTAPFGFRYQYLAGGVNTGSGWATWNANGSFVNDYVRESRANGVVPVFTYYMLFQSSPGAREPEAKGVQTNLTNVATMGAYWRDLQLFFQRASRESTHVVLHLEPDLWGYIEQRAIGDDAATVPAQVADAGLPELIDLPNNASGFARGIVRLRDRYAPNVLLGYHLSRWGVGEDIAHTRPSDAAVDAFAMRSARFYHSLVAKFDITFSEFSDRDAGFKQFVDKDKGASWWNDADYVRFARYLRRFAVEAGQRIVLWQIPLGNTRMRSMNNTWDHYQDNRVEWFLDDPTRAHLGQYVDAGVVALLFGRGADGATCACDAASDGVTNPPAINGNVGLATTADDDGGFFKERVREFYSADSISLPNGASVGEGR